MLDESPIESSVDMIHLKAANRCHGLPHFVCLALAAPLSLNAAGLPGDVLELEPVTVTEESDELTGMPDSATQGVVTFEQLRARPVARPGELLEFVPGLIATQHSGEGKANQYFLRGFNLDHGTDFSVTVDGVPVNMPTHGHGQGYSDLSFMIPELIGRLDYRKGPYYAEVGDFSAAGFAQARYINALPGPVAHVTVGEFGYGRALAANSTPLGTGSVLTGIAHTIDDGPWVLDDDLSQTQMLARYHSGDAVDGLTISLMGYDGEWTSTDQVPQRAIESGQIERLGFIDDTVGGESHRYSLSFDWRRQTGSGHWNIEGYALDYALNLFSNFTYFLENQNEGDQFQQVDDRKVFGLGAHRHWHAGTAAPWLGEIEVGATARHDAIGTVGLFRTERRMRRSTIRQDSVDQTLLSTFASVSPVFSSALRGVWGVRVDHLAVDVDAGDARNAGSANDTLLSPKFSLIYAPWRNSEFFFNAGRGFHSNDARGATIRIDPNSGQPADQVDLLVAADGIDLGWRASLNASTQMALSFWALELDSELVFVGDGGATEASGASERRGVEGSLFVRATDWLVLDADVAVSRARFDNGDRIPNAVERVASAGLTLLDRAAFSGGLRVRYLGEAPLIEDNSARSDATTIFNAQLSYQATPAITLRTEVFNLFDANDNDITYFYMSLLQGEPASGVDDFHIHPVEPRSVRLGIRWRL